MICFSDCKIDVPRCNERFTKNGRHIQRLLRGLEPFCPLFRKRLRFSQFCQFFCEWCECMKCQQRNKIAQTIQQNCLEQLNKIVQRMFTHRSTHNPHYDGHDSCMMTNVVFSRVRSSLKGQTQLHPRTKDYDSRGSDSRKVFVCSWCKAKVLRTNVMSHTICD